MDAIKYEREIEYIETTLREKEKLSWEEIRNKFGNSGTEESQMKINVLKDMSVINISSVEEWVEIVDYLMSIDKNSRVVKLGEATKNNVKIPTEKYSAWKLYENSLRNKKWSLKSIASIKQTSFQILQHLSTDTSETGAVKGLVIGNVQSGKTANMAGLMAMAADNGFNYFIVLSGVIENLRQQTSTRLFNDMNSSGRGNLHWIQVDKPSLSSSNPGHQLEKFQLDVEKSKNRYFTVSLKNKSRLQSLIKWLKSDPNKAKQMKILIIDDEADQASINTKNIEEETNSAINEQLLDLVNSKVFGSVNYIAYTATPFANILNETSKESLYPKDFITLLEPSEDYMGPKEIFGIESPETHPKINIIREITNEDKIDVEELQQGENCTDLPQSFKDSIHWYLITVAGMRALNYKKPITMLVHTSFKISHHQIIAKKIEEYLIEIKNNFSKIIKDIKVLYENEIIDLKKNTFIEAMKGYSTIEEIPDYPSWEEIERYLIRLVRYDGKEYVSHILLGEEGEPKYHNGIHLTIDNSKSKADNQIVRLVYPTGKNMPTHAPAFIVVGGNTLSRGLTLEGLTSTYFLRTTNQADTLLQMARWFGYRKGYEIFPRVWLDVSANQRFEFISQINEELRREIKNYEENGLTPLEYAPKVKQSPDRKLIRITSSNKSQSAEETDFNFAGFNSQTIYFERNEIDLQNNLSQARKFMNSLKTPKINNSKMIWNNVPSEAVKEFLENYKVCNMDIKMSNLPNLLNWLEENENKLPSWNVIYSSVGEIKNQKATEEDSWNIHGYSPKASKRTQLKNRSTEEISNIGVLRVPSDLLSDIDEELTQEEKGSAKVEDIQKIREKYGYANIPQLIIYKVDKGTLSKEELATIKSKNREPLNFTHDIIGLNIMIPGETRKTQFSTYVSANIKIAENQFIDESKYLEEEE